MSSANQPYAILRIKRKRNEEPLDVLVVETMRRKKSRGLGVFQYAETVEGGVWDSAERQQGIQEKISRLAQGTQQKPIFTSKATDPVLPKDEKVRRYTVVDHDEAELSPSPSKNPDEQPKSVNYFKLYDAVPTEQTPASQTTNEVDKFLPLLKDYLKIHDFDSDDNVITPSGISSSNELGDDHYVWDLFYHQPIISKWNPTAANVGMLTGLPSDFEGYGSLSESDEEYLDEADEDSNAEEYYKNDYPDEEDDSNSNYDSVVDSDDEFD